MKIIQEMVGEKEVQDPYFRQKTKSILYLAGLDRVYKDKSAEGQGEFDDYVYAYLISKQLHVPEKEIINLFRTCSGPDDIQKNLYTMYGENKKYADLYPNDETIPYNTNKRRKGK